VRKVLEYFNMPHELVYRKAFPGPALAARIIGPVTEENLSFEKEVHDLVESTVEDYYKEKHGKSMIINSEGYQEPFQVFAAVSENVQDKKVTGLVDGKRTYDYPLCEKGDWDFLELTTKASNIKGHTRLLFEMGSTLEGKYDVIIRSINSRDARTAAVTNLPFEILTNLKEKLFHVTGTKRVYVDLTPKPPATIEYV
jgi:GMP synthase (glutamine-hydrolysing)